MSFCPSELVLAEVDFSASVFDEFALAVDVSPSSAIAKDVFDSPESSLLIFSDEYSFELFSSFSANLESDSEGFPTRLLPPRFDSQKLHLYFELSCIPRALSKLR